ncbi:SufE family protein [Ferrimonas marina]|uniref:Cysteine desulfuration protein SufE n=1 Tax=Ferrimonas marina TaxID=299255 RepID=A0A1M5ZLI2_9GAMM|nr:SufE family protein [Ferrimonas marina]SHI25021.1 cysteine desulfuration protein SufE [Ferrimonas marina]
MTMPDANAFLCSPLGSEISQQGLTEELLSQPHWQARYRVLMKLGNRMEKLDASWHREEAEVSGCESTTWLYHHQQEGRHYFLADSDSRIVRGLLVLVLSASNGQSGDAIAAVDWQQWFGALGLADHLSPSRSNGLAAVVARIQQCTQAG